MSETTYQAICGALLLLLALINGRRGYWRGRHDESRIDGGWEDEALWWRRRFREYSDAAISDASQESTDKQGVTP